MKISVMRQGTRARPVTVETVTRWSASMLRAMGVRRAELSVMLCDDETIHTLNRSYRKKNKPTDVLAFALREGELGHLAGDSLGDVVISLDTARRQAEARGIHPREEVRMLLAHGILHLLGWDHQTDDEDARMRAETERLMARTRRDDRRA
ncbi:MAG: rRNA maturation RNase YbeY [Polyangiales bacterium]